MKIQDKYTYRVQWNDEDTKYVATVAELPSLSWLADTPDSALDGLRSVVDEVVEDMKEANEKIPEPFTERKYSGTFTLRLTKEQHMILSLEAAEQHVSLNKLVASRALGISGNL
jgi:predicted HicB family RNase H-like nuclease